MRLAPHWILLVPAALLLGCGGGRDATEKQLAELRAEIGRLRAGQAQMAERLDALDIERGTFKGASPTAAGPAAASPAAPSARAPDRDRPDLDVVHLSPSEGDGDADSDAPRPLVRAVGAEGGVRQTLSNKTPGARAPKKGITAAAPKDTKPSDADSRPGAKP